MRTTFYVVVEYFEFTTRMLTLAVRASTRRLNVVRLFTEILNREVSVPEPLDDIANQYYATKSRRHNYKREALWKCVKVVLKRDSNTDAKWMVTPLQLISEEENLRISIYK